MARSPSVSLDVVPRPKGAAYVLCPHSRRSGGEHGEDLLVGDAGVRHVGLGRRLGLTGQRHLRLAGCGEVGQFGLGAGEFGR